MIYDHPVSPLPLPASAYSFHTTKRAFTYAYFRVPLLFYVRFLFLFSIAPHITTHWSLYTT